MRLRNEAFSHGNIKMGNVIIAMDDFCNVTRPGGVEGEASFEEFRTGIMVTLIDPRATDTKDFKILISLIPPGKKASNA
ncbi:hypothetical protein BELL_1120g00020 [Botrytis elliptica]|uniref:Uncharacterized protein n=1 Tax=Botrytis elliptica TaxID=278938 RepID=A0A4Z1J0B5_9HELO|nr:hypothetical protein BELL_1120g00020 [Botrytis elliptica]